MDYKEIVEAMRCTDVKVVFCRSLDAADAIETLLAERDAAVEDLRMRTCQVCKHKDVDTFSPPCCFCYKKRNFEWRGPQKGDSHGT